MDKKITTGTKITFTETNDKFELTQTPTGFDVKRIKLSKNITPEPYTFQELLDLYGAGKITINGFEEADAALVNSILTNYIHTTEIEILKADITRITAEKEILDDANKKLLPAYDELTHAHEELTDAHKDLKAANEKITADNDELKRRNSELQHDNGELTSENKALKATNEKLNTALEAMDEPAKS